MGGRLSFEAKANKLKAETPRWSSGVRLDRDMKLSYLKILIAEDDENDRLLLQRAIAKTGARHEVHLVNDGQEAIEYLQAAGKFEDRGQYPFPNFMILDVKMPRLSGFEVLEWLQRHEECSVIPALILTSSAREEDIKQSYQLSANAYFTKPNNMDELVRLLTSIFDFWYYAHVPHPPLQEACK